jgi:putative FmdB family regulatory protein
MPIYEFLCQNCGREFERIQSFSDQSLPNCPACQSTFVQRKLSPPAVHFKGSGWYVTDSKNSTKSTASTKADEAGDQKAADSDSPNTTEKSAGEKSEAPAKVEAVKEKSSASKEVTT